MMEIFMAHKEFWTMHGMAKEKGLHSIIEKLEAEYNRHWPQHTCGRYGVYKVTLTVDEFAAMWP